jgi:dTDP-4-dehydrorhamnose reductase
VKWLITGGGGQLASDLQELIGASATSFSRSALDITDPAALDRAYAEVKPDVVVNCAAFHNVDVCESEPDAAWACNVRAVRDMAQRGPKLVHLSTNYVFDGERGTPYGEDDVPNPGSVYAITKLAGEFGALAYGDDPLVIRAAGLYGLHGSASKGGNFVERMTARAKETGQIKMVDDQLLQPTFTVDLAAAILDAVERDACGLVHLTAEDECSWFQFTAEFLRLRGIEAELEPVQTTVAPGQPARPLNGVLARPRADAIGLPRLRDWREQLADYVARTG